MISLATAARHRRQGVFNALLASLPAPLSILDVGGTVEFWHDVVWAPTVITRIVLFNQFPQSAETPFESVVGDARDLSRYQDREFDLVFSNSVIGHVGGWPEQQQMAREVRRAGAHYFLQTPNHGFPVDWRTLVPCFHWLPHAAQAWCFRHVPVGTYRRATSEDEASEWATRVRNLRRRELPLLFPDAVVVNERILALTKSFIVHNMT